MYWLYIILHRAHADIIYIKYLHFVYYISLVYNYLYSEREYISYSISISTLQKCCILLQVRCISVALQQKLYNPIILTQYRQKKNRHFWRLSCYVKKLYFPIRILAFQRHFQTVYNKLHKLVEPSLGRVQYNQFYF